jgi:hypothetical protein
MKCSSTITSTACQGAAVPCGEAVVWQITKNRVRKLVCRYHLAPAIAEMDGGAVRRVAPKPRKECRK